MPTSINLTGQQFGRLSVLGRAGKTKNGMWRWRCGCVCKNETTVQTTHLKSGNTVSCGCRQKETGRENSKLLVRKKGLLNDWSKIKQQQYGDNYISSADYWYLLARNRYRDAKKRGITIEFSSTHEFATYCKSIAPERCPVFDQPWTKSGKKGHNSWSYSIDRIDPSIGYVRGNIQIISMKANAMKRNATPDELLVFARWVVATAEGRHV